MKYICWKSFGMGVVMTICFVIIISSCTGCFVPGFKYYLDNRIQKKMDKEFPNQLNKEDNKKILNEQRDDWYNAKVVLIIGGLLGVGGIGGGIGIHHMKSTRDRIKNIEKVNGNGRSDR